MHTLNIESNINDKKLSFKITVRNADVSYQVIYMSNYNPNIVFFIYNALSHSLFQV